MELFKIKCRDYEIRDEFALKLRALDGFEIFVVCDDSGSMNTPVTTPGADPYGKLETRWDELKRTVSKIVEIASIVNTAGIHVFFLNRPGLMNVTYKGMLDQPFNLKATGSTPMVPVLKSIFQQKSEKRRLVIVATDGCPDDVGGICGVNCLRDVLQYQRAPTDYVTILACTDDVGVMKYLNGWDVELERLDVVDDYRSERQQIQAVQGPDFQFSFGDYIVKCMLGAIDPDLDNLDEVPCRPTKSISASSLNLASISSSTRTRKSGRISRPKSMKNSEAHPERDGPRKCCIV